MKKPTNQERIARLRKWVCALRSGKFTRTTGKLQRVRLGEKRNCCIGVAGRIAKLNVDDEDISTYRVIADYYCYRDDQQQKLFGMNDQSHGSFEKIANWIEKNLIGVKGKK